jgi:glycosyltransferase involved in cell wall biosynthesis
MKKLFIIGNEKISDNGKNFFAANVDFKTIIEGLAYSFNIKVLARKSKKHENFLVNYKDITLSSNIFTYLLNIFLVIKKKKNNIYFIISITPFTFFSSIILFLFSKNIFLYLRSDGFKEYEAILGKKWVFLYKIMFLFMTKKSKIISCHKDLSRGIPYCYVRPSELDDLWFLNRKINTPNKNINFLFVGRIRVEKGIFFLLDIFYKLNSKYNLTIVGDKKINFQKSSNINFFNFFDNAQDLIDCYDSCNIFILPSYTEAHPKVIDEALSRLKPIIIFDDIAHVVEDRIGIFKTQRNLKDFINTADHIKKNYGSIVNEIYKNNLPTKKNFLQDLINIID